MITEKLRDSHQLAGKTVTLKSKDTQLDCQKYWVEDWYVNMGGTTVLDDLGNAAAIIYRQRVQDFDLPRDHDYVYGKIGAFGHIVHISELGEVDETIPVKYSSYNRPSDKGK